MEPLVIWKYTQQNKLLDDYCNVKLLKALFGILYNWGTLLDFIKTSYGYHVCCKCIQQGLFGTEIKMLVWRVSLCDKTLLATNSIFLRAKNIKKLRLPKSFFSVRSKGSSPPLIQIQMSFKRKARNLLHSFPMLPSNVVALWVPQSEPYMAEVALILLAEC